MGLQKLRRSIRSKLPAERGQILVLTAGAMVALLGFAALAIDVGFFFHTRREIQNAADAMALAAVREQPDDLASDIVAVEWADKNEVQEAEVLEIGYDETCDGEALPDIVTVRLKRNQATFLAKIFGITDGDVTSCATARTGLAQGGADLLPWGLLWDRWTDDPSVPGGNPPPVCYYDENPVEASSDPKDPGNRVAPYLDEKSTFWYDPASPSLAQCRIIIPSPNETWAAGNSGPLRLDDNQAEPDNWMPGCDLDQSNGGDSEYGENIQDGSECGYSINDAIQTKPGSVPKTCEEVSTKLVGHESDTIADVFIDTDGDGIYDLVNVANPHYGLIPIVYVQPGSSGSSTNVILRDFVPVFLHSCQKVGSNFVITVTPVKSVVYVAGINFVGPSDQEYFPDDWPLHTIKLIN